MAEFKLGRIRFIWKGDWAGSTVYYKDDIVRNGGNTYVCVNGHTSAVDFADDMDTYWNKISDGQEWKGDWQTETYYKVNDIVKYGGLLYICNTAHTSAGTAGSGLEADLGTDSTQPKWDLFAEGFDYKESWTVGTRYKINDIVKYGGTVYLCTVEHTSALLVADGLEEDQDKWDIFSEGFVWKADWTAATRYKVNDMVKYGGTLYVCVTGHTSAASAALGLEADQAKWNYAHKGVEYKGNFQSATRYKINDLVKYGGNIWICTQYHTSQTLLAEDESKWAIFVDGLEFENSWNAGVSYQPGDFVTYGGYSFVSKTNNNAKKPTDNPADWDLFTTGFRFVGDWGEDSSNYEYLVGDVVRVSGYTYVCTADHTGQRPPNTSYWQRLNYGFEWKDAWADATYYDLGDVVSHGVNSYICIQEHTSDEIATQNRPDQDVLGDYWNVMSGGPETGNLTTEGDLVYYGGAGPTRLPIGTPGQVLQVNSAGDAPVWANFGSINHVYYVEGEAGVDEPAPSYGITIDRPWKTVRYAAEQIEAGALRPNAKYLLERNRSFIQAEIVEWTDYQITNNIAPFTTSFTYDKELCRRDMGFIVDAIAHDLSHGGNQKVREAALAYFNGATSYIAGQEGETVASITYGLEVIDAVLTNFDPAANYQTLNAVGSPIAQLKDLTRVEEDDAQTLTETLAGVITDAITAGSIAGIPAIRRPNNTIFVKTGTFNEVLPIIVPADCAVVGDELRSTRIEPAGSLVSSADTPYSLDAISRLQAIIPDIITNASVSKTTTGSSPNTETQDTTRPAGSTGSTSAITAINSNADEIVDILQNGVGNADSLTYTDTGVTAKTTARTELQTNRTTIISDLIAWIGTTYPALVYDQTKCERDTGYIIDAISYDVQYGGNWATVIAASAYYEGAVAVLPSGQTAETAAAITQLSTIAQGYMSGATEQGEVDTLLASIENVITNGIGFLPSITYPSITWASAELQSSHAALLAAKDQIQSDTVLYVKANNSGLDFNNATCSRDTGYIVEALAYDMAFGSNVQSIFAGLAYYRGTASAQLVISDQLDATVGAVRFIKHAAKYAAANGAAAVASELFQDLYDWINYEVNTTGTKPSKCGSDRPQGGTGYTYAVEAIEANREFIVAEIVAYIADQYPGYTYDVASCTRDVNRYIDAIKYDLIYLGNYKTTLAARYYSNAVNGSTQEDMFYMRNGTGLRNCTVAALSGTLGSANVYGTQRPSAGAFVSLDPGWGPNDSRAWITARSPYIQNVTTFGTACVGLKVDGDLHAGGNDSIVANDFTQILSDGIGAWVTNLARAELVSVFSYYGHIGYLAENGGKIRATNGNSSYGKYGTVAEGVDVTEVPITGTVDNHTFQAIVTNVMTDGNQILTFEFLNAGQHYTDATDAITAITSVSGPDPARATGTYFGVTGTSSGAGTGFEFDITVEASGAATVQITRGGSGNLIGDVITIDDLDLGGGGAANLTFTVQTVGDGTNWSVTGEGYGSVISATNVVDGGVFEVRLLDPADNYGGADYVTAQNVAVEGDATTITLSNTDVGLSSTYTGMAIFITSGVGAGQYGYINSYNAGTKIAQIYKMSDGTAGWDHVVSGTAIETTLDDTTNYIIEPRILFTAPPSGLYADTAKGRVRVEDGKVVEIRLWDPGNGYLLAPTMTLVDPNNTVDVPHEVRIGNGVLTQPTWSNRGTSFATAQVTVVGDGYADLYQNGQYLQVTGLSDVPQAGSNVEIAGIPATWYKLVSVTGLLGNGPYSARLQISPLMTITDAPEHEEEVTMRIRYSQVRLTGHDFLDIGTGNFTDTNYPGIPVNNPDPTKETNDFGGGRVFYTSTDQDGNFRVGELFSIEQATGIATLNADAFNISGLQELQLGSVTLGGTSAVITEFSTDGTFTANSDNIVPTQKAIKTYIQSQIGGGAGELNVNSITAGLIAISTNEITTTNGSQINTLQKVNFKAGVDGHPLAMNYYLLS